MPRHLRQRASGLVDQLVGHGRADRERDALGEHRLGGGAFDRAVVHRRQAGVAKSQSDCGLDYASTASRIGRVLAAGRVWRFWLN